MGSTPLQDRSSIRFTLAVAFLPTGISAISGICPDRQELLPTASAGVRSTFGTLFKAFPQVQHLVTAGLEAAIFAVNEKHYLPKRYRCVAVIKMVTATFAQ